MKILSITLTLAAMLCTVLTTLGAVVSCMAMGANAKPPDIRILKFWMLGLTILGLLGITAGVFLMRAGLLGWAAGASITPTLIIGMITLIVLIK